MRKVERPQPADRAILTNWWLAVSKGANTPNWDLAITALPHLENSRAGALPSKPKDFWTADALKTWGLRRHQP